MLVTTEKQYAIVMKGDVDIIVGEDGLANALNSLGRTKLGLNKFETGVLKVVNVTPDIGTGEFHVQHGVKSSKIAKQHYPEMPDALPETVVEVVYYADIIRYKVMSAVLSIYDNAITKIEGGDELKAKYKTAIDVARRYLTNSKDSHAKNVLTRMLTIGERNSKFKTPSELAKFIVALWDRRDHLVIAKDKFYKEATTATAEDDIYTYDDVQALLEEHADIVANIK